MLSHAASLQKLLTDGFLWDALQQCDVVLDFLYQYDAEKLLTNINVSTKLTQVDWHSIERTCFNDSFLANQNILDTLVGQAIDLYEGLHARIRETWRKINDNIITIQVGNRPHLITSGFVLIVTPNNKTLVYYFDSPKGKPHIDWRKFKLQYVTEFDYNPETILGYIAEIKNLNEERIIYKSSIKDEANFRDGCINIISSNIFMQLRKDYGF
jgi:hypothetical protein